MFISRMVNEQQQPNEVVNPDTYGLYTAKMLRSRATGRLMRSSIFVSAAFAFIIVWTMFTGKPSTNDIVANSISVTLGMLIVVTDVIRLKKADARVWDIRGQMAEDNLRHDVEA